MADEKEPTREMTTIVADREIAKQIRTIADHRDITMGEALKRYAGSSILREYKKVLTEQLHTADLGGEGG